MRVLHAEARPAHRILSCCRRWQKLNRSLERVTAVHDGGPDAGAMASGDAAGIRIDALHEVGGTHGWDMPCMTQLIACSAGGLLHATSACRHIATLYSCNPIAGGSVMGHRV